MIIEIKFIIITLLICVSQFFQLAILGIFFKNIDPKINFLITSILCYLLIIYYGVYFFKIEITFIIGSIILLTSSIIINFTLWSMFIWGFTISLLGTIKKKEIITKSKWIKNYTGGKNLEFFTYDRIKLLSIINSIKKHKEKRFIQINCTGIIISKIYKFLKKNIFYV
tara:strand:- start:879 stop:1382 length:504 start_codon:yes stop_codon:yes gene_type:complete